MDVILGVLCFLSVGTTIGLVFQLRQNAAKYQREMMGLRQWADGVQREKAAYDERFRLMAGQHQHEMLGLRKWAEDVQKEKAALAERFRITVEQHQNEMGSLRKWAEDVQKEKAALQDRFRPILDVESARAIAETDFAKARDQWLLNIEELRKRHGQAKAETRIAHQELEKTQKELSALSEEANLQSVAFYKPHYDFSDSAKYQKRLESILSKQKQMLKSGEAAVCPIEWTVDGSAAKGRKQTEQMLKLMLRAFHGECDAAIAKVKYNNVGVMEKRIRKACEAITALASVQQCSITEPYLELKLQELFLSFEYEEKVQAEKEEQRRIREQMKDEEAAQRELEKAQQEAEQKENQFEEALRKAQEQAEKASGAKHDKLMAQIEDLERKLAEAHALKQKAISQAQLTKTGNVYVISNIGSFGENIFKIGMTRRLVPEDRIRELGDASVPFSFDVHAMISSSDAPALEAELHKAFYHRRVNWVNDRKEFYRVSIDEIEEAVKRLRVDVEVKRMAEAEEYRRTQAMIREQEGPGLQAGAESS